MCAKPRPIKINDDIYIVRCRKPSTSAMTKKKACFASAKVVMLVLLRVSDRTLMQEPSWFQFSSAVQGNSQGLLGSGITSSKKHHVVRSLCILAGAFARHFCMISSRISDGLYCRVVWNIAASYTIPVVKGVLAAWCEWNLDTSQTWRCCFDLSEIRITNFKMLLWPIRDKNHKL